VWAVIPRARVERTKNRDAGQNEFQINEQHNGDAPGHSSSRRVGEHTGSHGARIVSGCSRPKLTSHQERRNAPFPSNSSHVGGVGDVGDVGDISTLLALVDGF
jgi:hypothetical protein